MRGHLGAKVSALLDGQLDPVETERAWAHVHACHACRDLVEREGWIKTRLAGLALGGSETAPDSLKGALRGGTPAAPHGLPAAGSYLAGAGGGAHRGRRTAGAVALGGGAVGAAVLGVVALGLAPADVSQVDRRAPTTQIGTPAARPTPTPGSSPGSSTGPSTGPSSGPRPAATPTWVRRTDAPPQVPVLVRP